MQCSAADQDKLPLEQSLPQKDVVSSGLVLACSNCHALMSDGMPDISSLTAEQIEASLNSYKQDKDGTTVMHRLMRGYADEDIRVIADALGADDE